MRWSHRIYCAAINRHLQVEILSLEMIYDLGNELISPKEEAEEEEEEEGLRIKCESHSTAEAVVNI